VRDLDAAAADVDGDADLVGQPDTICRGQVNEAGLFGARDDARANTGLLDDGLQELAAVLGLAYGTRGHSLDPFDLVRLGKPAEF
jgi:hypothetical protein